MSSGFKSIKAQALFDGGEKLFSCFTFRLLMEVPQYHRKEIGSNFNELAATWSYGSAEGAGMQVLIETLQLKHYVSSADVKEKMLCFVLFLRAKPDMVQI